MNPIVPGITSKPALLERTHEGDFRATVRVSLAAMYVFLDGGTRDHFMRWLEQEFPSWSTAIRALHRQVRVLAVCRRSTSSARSKMG